MRKKLDLLIKDALIVDGSGDTPIKKDVGIAGKAIEIIHEGLEDAIKIIHAPELILAPGFIDMHSHTDLHLMDNSNPEHRLRQGITAEVIGQDGFSLAPLIEGRKREAIEAMTQVFGPIEVSWDWSSFKEYRQRLESLQLSSHILPLVGHATIRAGVMGLSALAPTKNQLNAMKDLLREAMESGAFGLSAGLIYPPSSYASLDELVELAKVVERFHGLFMVHMRDEMDHLLTSIEEMISIARESGVHIHISHLKCMGPRNWGKAIQALNKIDSGLREGLSISFDQYPYTSSSTSLKACLPTWALEGGEEALLQRLRDPTLNQRIRQETQRIVEARGGPARILLISICDGPYQDFEGKTLLEVATHLQLDPISALLMILKEEGSSINAIYNSLSEEDVREIIRHPAYTVCTDGLNGTHPHPRTYGAFPRLLSRYVKEEGLLNLQKAIHHMTKRPASLLGLRGRGTISPGAAADIILFNREEIRDAATFQRPKEHALGIEYLMVEGRLLIEEGEYKGGEKRGRFLKRGEDT